MDVLELAAGPCSDNVFTELNAVIPRNSVMHHKFVVTGSQAAREMRALML